MVVQYKLAKITFNILLLIRRHSITDKRQAITNNRRRPQEDIGELRKGLSILLRIVGPAEHPPVTQEAGRTRHPE